MKTQELEVPQQEVQQELKNLKKGIKKGYISKRQKLTKELLAVYGHLQHGGKIVDLPLTFSKLRLRKDDSPKLAIVQADAKFCYLYKLRNGGAIFSNERKNWAEVKGNDITLPPDTFNWQNLDQNRLKTIAPIIPPRIHVAIQVRVVPEHYHVLFEADTWTKSTPPRDPILGKMLTRNLFGVLATWDLTELERKIISGRI